MATKAALEIIKAIILGINQNIATIILYIVIGLSIIMTLKLCVVISNKIMKIAHRRQHDRS